MSSVASLPATSGGAPPMLGLRRAPRHVVVGAALMVAFALVFAMFALRADPATAVLSVARAVPAGATITDADLTVVRVVPDPGLQVVTESQRQTVVGATATVPLVAGSLLSPAQVGPAAWPPAGESVVAVPVAAGRLPAGLSAGSRVTVLVPGSGGSEATQPVSASAVVVAVEPPSAAGVSTVSLLLGSAQARQVAGAGGEVVLVLDPPSAGG